MSLLSTSTLGQWRSTTSAVISGVASKCHESLDKVEVDWKIDKFLEIASNAKNLNIKSQSFRWFSTNWQLEIAYTSGNELKMFIHKSHKVKKLSVALKFGIRLANGTFETRSYHTKAFRDQSNSWGTNEMILESELKERMDELMPEGNLTLSCSMVLLEAKIQSKKRKYEHPGDLSSDLMSLFESNKNSDTVIAVGEQNYLVHKAILAARSDVFAAMFQHNMQEANSNIINVTDCDPTTFKDFLLFLYTDKIENFSFDSACQLYKIGDKYNVEGVKNLSVDYITQNLSVSNLFDVAILANQFNDIQLIRATEKFFTWKAVEITQLDTWEHFMRENFSTANKFLINAFKRLKAIK